MGAAGRAAYALPRSVPPLEAWPSVRSTAWGSMFPLQCEADVDTLNRIQFQELCDAVVDAYELDSLAQMTRTKLGRRLDVLIDVNAGLGQVVFQLVEYAENAGWEEELVRGVYEERSGNPLVKAFCESHARYVFDPRPTTKDFAGQVMAGLNEVAGRLHGARDAIRTILAGDAQERLTELGDRFSRLRRYKVLHDCLHNLQFKYARLIGSGLKILSGAPEEADNLRILYAEMSDELNSCRPELAGLPSATAETLWLNVADESVLRLVRGLDANDATKSKSGIQLLEGLLRVQPTRINELLTGVLEGLRFEDFVAAFRRMRDEVAADAAWSTALSSATTALGSLAPRLNRVLSDHKDWQLVDVTLRQIDTDLKLGSDASLAEVLWREAERVLRALLDQDREAKWSDELRALADGLGLAFAGAAAGGVKTAFNRLTARTTWFFYQADKSLKELASDLDSVGSKLAVILKGVL